MSFPWASKSCGVGNSIHFLRQTSKFPKLGMVHRGTETGKCSPSQDCEKDMASRETQSLPGMVHKVQALL